MAERQLANGPVTFLIMPKGLNMSLPDEKEVRSGRQIPHYTLNWRVKRTDWDIRPRHVGLTLSLVATELEMDMGGERERVEVDGVQGWLSHLSAEDFVPPPERRDVLRELLVRSLCLLWTPYKARP